MNFQWLFTSCRSGFHDKEIWRISVRLSDRSKVYKTKYFLSKITPVGFEPQPPDHLSNALPTELG